MRKLFIISILVLLTFAAVRAYQQHVIGQGRLLQATAFENGDALVLVQTETGLTLYYHDAGGIELGQAALYLSAVPETLFVSACGRYTQVFIGYAPSVPDDLSTATVERYVWEMPHIQTCEQQEMFLPLVVGE